MIKSKDMDNFHGLMVDAIKEFGKMVSKMVKESIRTNKIVKDKVFGRMEKRLNGQLEMINFLFIFYQIMFYM